METSSRRYLGLLLDFMGVLTSDLFEAHPALSLGDGLPADAVLDFLTKDPDGHHLLMNVESGTFGRSHYCWTSSAKCELRA